MDFCCAKSQNYRKLSELCTRGLILLVLGKMDNRLWDTRDVSLFANLGANGHAAIPRSLFSDPCCGPSATVLQVACARGKEELVEELLSSSLTFTNDQVVAGLRLASNFRHGPVVKLLVGGVQRGEAALGYALADAVANKRTNVVQILLDVIGADRVESLYEALLFAANHEDDEMLNVLVAHAAYDTANMRSTVALGSHAVLRDKFGQKEGKKKILYDWLSRDKRAIDLGGSVRSWLH